MAAVITFNFSDKIDAKLPVCWCIIDQHQISSRYKARLLYKGVGGVVDGTLQGYIK